MSTSSSFISGQNGANSQQCRPRQSRAAAKPFERIPDEQLATSAQMYALSAAFGLGSVGALALAGVYTLGCPSDRPLLTAICTDSHYKYLVPLLVPVTAWFVIANWVGWQFFRFS